ncbi:hypothetical protein [Streptomyces sp. NPDC049906]|uniref:hypothetical protein n=1 Tax=Streptomyces sp. NPDC049906 TaxID=3155656 RepID=UPI003419A4F2
MKFRSMATTCSLMVGLAVVPVVAASPASAAASAAAACVSATYHLDDNAVTIRNGCSTVKRYRVAERFWPDSDCFTIQPGRSKYYRATGTIQGIKAC